MVEEKYPENSEGIMTEDEITVKYYYRRLSFNMKLDNPNTKYLTHEEVFSKARRIIDGEK